MSRAERERAILELVEEETIRTQEELAEELARRGFPVAQSTVSRDVRRLGLARVPLPDGGSRYGHPEDAAGSEAARERLGRLLREEVAAVEPGGALLVLRTPPGLASAVAAALDEADLDGLVGSLAGDDTVLVVARDATARDRLLRRLRSADVEPKGSG